MPGHDGLHGFWFKKFISIHDWLGLEMCRCLQGTNVPEGMTKRKITLIQRPLKGTASNNCRPITCLPMMWIILAAQIRTETYCSLTSRVLFPEEEKGYCKGSSRTRGLVYIHQRFLNESNTRWTNLAMTWILLQKTYDMVKLSWIIYCLKIIK